ncbi:2-polyprenylphenol 6-hydroxylase [Dishui Lake large algae virus 1]|nr:2-polyprenylphenol 6-hydroxylase [Dishui Lake large algae virus 1]
MLKANNTERAACKVKTSPVRIWRFAAEVRIRTLLQKDKKAVGKWMKDELIGLGPAFIKLGQFLSTRSDFLGKEIANELSNLQDNIPSVSFSEIDDVFFMTTGKHVNDLFTSFDENPIASASIGQVHKARLLSGGKEVVVKVQKPCVARQICDDLQTLKDMNEILKKTGSKRSYEIDNLLKEYSRFLSSELDYRSEMKHMIDFGKIYDDRSNVIIPKVYPKLSNDMLLVMEYVPSTKITDIDTLRKMKVDTVLLSNKIVDMYLSQIVIHGLVHCDPHPGNIGVAKDGETIVLYDFGNVIELSDKFRRKINNLVFAIYQKDSDEFIDQLIDLNILKLTKDDDVMDLKVFFNFFFEYLETLDFTELKDSILSNEALQQSNLSFKVEPNFLSIFRIFSLLDGTCALLNPQFSYIDTLAPYAQNAFFDTDFLQYKAQKDLDTFTSYSKQVKDTNYNIIRVDKKIKDVSQNNLAIQGLFAAWLLFDGVHDPVKLVTFFILLAWMVLRS